jgi:hypothetical protein
MDDFAFSSLSFVFLLIPFDIKGVQINFNFIGI